MNEEYDDTGKIKLWRFVPKNPETPNPPAATGHFFAHRDIKEGEKIRVSLWKKPPNGPTFPVMTGKIEDKHVKEEPADQPFVDSSEDIPF